MVDLVRFSAERGPEARLIEQLPLEAEHMRSPVKTDTGEEILKLLAADLRLSTMPGRASARVEGAAHVYRRQAPRPRDQRPGFFQPDCPERHRH